MYIHMYTKKQGKQTILQILSFWIFFPLLFLSLKEFKQKFSSVSESMLSFSLMYFQT